MSFEGVFENIICWPVSECWQGTKDSRKVSRGELKPELHFRINEQPNLMGMGFPETARQS